MEITESVFHYISIYFQFSQLKITELVYRTISMYFSSSRFKIAESVFPSISISSVLYHTLCPSTLPDPPLCFAIAVSVCFLMSTSTSLCFTISTYCSPHPHPTQYVHCPSHFHTVIASKKTTVTPQNVADETKSSSKCTPPPLIELEITESETLIQCFESAIRFTCENEMYYKCRTIRSICCSIAVFVLFVLVFRFLAFFASPCISQWRCARYLRGMP